MSSYRSGVKDQHGGNYAEAVTRGATGVEGGTYQDEDEVGGGGHHDVQDDVEWDANWGRGLELTPKVAREYEDASILKGDTSSKENSQVPIESEFTNIVSTPDFLTDVSMDGSASFFLQYQEQTVKDDTDEDGHLEQAVNEETVRDELPPDRKVISAKVLLQQSVDMDSQDWSVLLPEELVLFLFRLLKPGDILTTSQTCRLWRKLGENEKLWEQKCKEAGLAFTLTAANLSALKRRSKKSRIVYSAWKENFLKPYKIAKKFIQEDPQVLTVEMSHSFNHMKIFNDKIVTSCENKLYVFCALGGGLMQELVGHIRHVEVIEIDKQFIVSGSRDSVKMWSVDNGSCLHTLLIHTVEYSCLQIHGTIVVTGSYDGTLRMWDVQEGRCFRTMTGHNGSQVDHIEFDGRLVVSGAEWPDSLIMVWDPQTGECLRTLDQEKGYYSIKLHGGHLLVIHPDDSIDLSLMHPDDPDLINTLVWDVDTGVCRHTLVGTGTGSDAEEYMDLLDDLLVSKSETSAKIWSLSTGACLHTLDGLQKYNSDFGGIGVNDKFVVTSSCYGKVILWDVKTGEFIRDLFMLEDGNEVWKMEMKEAKIVFVVYEEAQARTKLLVLNFDTKDAD